MPDLITNRVPIAKQGLNEYDNPASLKGLYSPYMKNMLIEGKTLRKFRGYRRFKEGSDIVRNLKVLNSPEIGQRILQYNDAVGNNHLIAVTDTNIFKWIDQGENFSWSCISRGLSVDSCDTDWTKVHASFSLTGGGGVEYDKDTLQYDDSDTLYNGSVEQVSGEGLFGVNCDTSAADTNIIAYNNFSSIDLTAHTHVSGWIRRGSQKLTNSPTLVISEAANGAKTGDYVEVTIPDPDRIDTWRFFSVEVDLSNLNAAVSIGVYNDNLTADEWFYLDEIRVTTPLVSNFPTYNFVRGTIATDTNMFTNNGGDALIVTNNVMNLSYFEGHLGDYFKELNENLPGFTNCVDIIEFWNYFMLLNYKVSDTQYVKGIQHSGAGNIDDFATDSSGSYFLFDSKGDILRVFKVNYSLTIFSEDSITFGNYLGSITKFQFPTATFNLGLIHPNAACVVKNTIFFIGSDRIIYALPIGQQPIEIGRNIVNLSEKFLDIDKYRTSFVTYFSKLNRVLFCTENDSLQTEIYSYNLNESPPAWEYFVFNHQIVDIRNIKIPNKKYPFVTSREMVFLALSYDCKLYSLDESYNDSGSSEMDNTNSSCEYQTEDLSINDEFEFARWQEFTFTAKSSIASASVIVEYSIDNGSTWKAVDESPIYLENNEWKTYLVHFDVVSRVIRLRFTQTAKDLQIKDDMFISYIPELGEGKEIEVK